MSGLQVSVEQDGSVELQSVTAAFPGTTSIKYRNPATQVRNTHLAIEHLHDTLLIRSAMQ